MKLTTLCLLAALCAFPVAAVPFTVNFLWTHIAGPDGGSADFFDFQFVAPSGDLKLTQMSVTLGNNLMYDLVEAAPGHMNWGAYALTDGGAGATQTSPDLGEGTSGNRTIAWNFASFLNGVTLRYGADVDATTVCAAGITGAICRTNGDSVTTAGFISRGAVDVAFTVAFTNGDPGASFSFPASGQSWIDGVVIANTSYSGEVFAPAPVTTPEPASWALGLGGLSLCALLRRKLL